ncbi:hypothetical protein HHI36_008008 [Cryptolaemus montrouzieri]|uniref:Uncharacterized protein n=1 Tax=Cryptolaemus montrouzieri TaxID=559131 RepID=A0ABD2MR42_9CUCU
MEGIEDCGSQSQAVNDSLGKIDWPQNQSTSTNSGNSTLLYIAVAYVKGEYTDEADTSLSPVEHFSNFQHHVSTLDPNMSSVARYSPVYNDPSNNFNPVVIHHLVSPETNEGDTTFVNNLNMNPSLEALPTVLCNADLNNVGNQYLHMAENVNTENNNAMESLPDDPDSNKEQVEILITDQATGISYSVSTQELLVEEQQLLEALSPNPLLDSDLLTIDESTLKNNLPEDLIGATDTTTTEPNIEANFISNFTTETLKVEYPEEDGYASLRSRTSTNELETEDKLLSRVYSIIDRPIPTRARATLPETYLKIMKMGDEWAVFAKKSIRIRTQFGPVNGVLKNKEEVITRPDKLELLVLDEDERIFSLDTSDENQSNWMCFIRRAETYEEQNLVVSQHANSLYFTVIRNILPKQELKVGYSYLYANQHSFPVLEKDTMEEEWPCFECTEQFPTSQDLQNHLNMHDENKKEKMKFKRRMWRSKNKLVKVATTEACQCRICQQIFNPPKYSALKNHLVSKHNLVDKCVEEHFFIVRNYKCEKCNLVFNSESLFKIHNIQHNPDDNSDDETYHICPSCNRKFPTQRQLILHVSLHSLPKYKIIPERFQCPVCYTFYPMRERLQRHMLVHGPEESKPLQCPQCKKRFMNNSALTCHLKTHILGENIYECPICKDRFDHVPKLKMHVQKHCVNNTYTCPQCNKKFKAYSVIRKHIRAFHNDQKHTCQHCSKFFPTIDKLKMHLLRHSDHREFLCADCGKQFKRKDKLTEHCKRIHSEERENNIPPAKPKDKNEAKKFVPKVEPTDFHRFIYKCHPCLIGFKRRDWIKGKIIHMFEGL